MGPELLRSRGARPRVPGAPQCFGGHLVIEGFHRDFGEPDVRGEPFGYLPNELLAVFGALRVLRYEEVRDRADWGRGRVEPLVRFVARKP